LWKKGGNKKNGPQKRERGREETQQREREGERGRGDTGNADTHDTKNKPCSTSSSRPRNVHVFHCPCPRFIYTSSFCAALIVHLHGENTVLHTAALGRRRHPPSRSRNNTMRQGRRCYERGATGPKNASGWEGKKKNGKRKKKKENVEKDEHIIKYKYKKAKTRAHKHTHTRRLTKKEKRKSPKVRHIAHAHTHTYKIPYASK
jgi:hypothetical protein